MKNHKDLILRLKSRRGVVAVLIAVIIVVLLGFVALAVDIGYVAVTKNELQNISDAAALAATRQLGHQYESLTYQQQQSFVCDPSTIIPVAQDVGLKNKAATTNITINAGDVVIGKWDTDTKTFTPTLNQPNAVKVAARRDDVANTPIPTFFGKVLGVNTVKVWANATAALTGQSVAAPGGLPVPVGISKYWFDNQPLFHFCNQPIRFYPTNDPTSCAGWHVFDRYSNAPDSRLRQTITDLDNGSYQSPETTAGQTHFEFTGGTMSTHTYDAMRQLFLDNLNTDTNGDGTNDAWTAEVPVYDSPDCSNPHGSILIVGFATIVITGVQSPPVHQIDGYVICNSYKSGRGGGGNYGTMGVIPGLVQ